MTVNTTLFTDWARRLASDLARFNRSSPALVSRIAVFAVALAPIVASCDVESDTFDPVEVCDVLFVTGLPAIANDGQAKDANGDGLVVLCFDEDAARQLLP